jgi:hypothetical protein
MAKLTSPPPAAGSPPPAVMHPDGLRLSPSLVLGEQGWLISATEVRLEGVVLQLASSHCVIPNLYEVKSSFL